MGSSVNSAGGAAGVLEQNQSAMNARRQGAKIMAAAPIQSNQIVKPKRFAATPKAGGYSYAVGET